MPVQAVAFDTNVLVSALVVPGSQGEAALRRVIDGTDRRVLSRAILDELLEVLGRRFARDAEELAHVAVAGCSRSLAIGSIRSGRPCKSCRPS
jgi:predicted nucleic acid-binding protein